MIKFVGSVILILCGIICGVEKSLKYIKHVEFLKDYFEFLMDLKNQINYSQCSIFNVINKFKTRKFLGKYFEKFEKIVKVKSFEFAWELSFENIRKTFDLSGEEELFILSFAKNFGKTDVKGQINYIDYNLDTIKFYINSALETKKKKQKLPVILGVCLSLLIVTFLV
ncbi:MAG: stage III sporulation protein AB [Clostridia bacterium]|nr:stage III sporulation protein AB [Clostridia bacterium]